jgi:hypothetical protein
MLNKPEEYEVINLGIVNTTMMKTGDKPYWNEEFY